MGGPKRVLNFLKYHWSGSLLPNSLPVNVIRNLGTGLYLTSTLVTPPILSVVSGVVIQSSRKLSELSGLWMPLKLSCVHPRFSSGNTSSCKVPGPVCSGGVCRQLRSRHQVGNVVV
jgi:hypothetical protein